MNTFISKIDVSGPKSFAGHQWHEVKVFFNPADYQENDQESLSFDLPSNFSNFHMHKKAEFVASRISMETLYRHLGIADSKANLSKKQFPTWPQGHLGSLSHTKGVAVFALANATRLKGIGVDCERLERCQQVENVWTKIATHEEREFFHKNRWRDSYWKLILFSVKESLYKAAYPLVEQYFGFEQAQILALDPQSQELELHSDFLSARIPGLKIHARYDLEGDLVKTLVLLD